MNVESHQSYLPHDVTYEQGLTITWADRSVVDYPPLFLRDACPCAACVDEMSGKKTLRSESIPADIHIVSADYVGRYALRIKWSDGHDSGIYAFRFLRQCFELAQNSPTAGPIAGPTLRTNH